MHVFMLWKQGGTERTQTSHRNARVWSLECSCSDIVSTAPSCSLHNDLQMFSGVFNKIFLSSAIFTNNESSQQILQFFLLYNEGKFCYGPKLQDGCRVLDAIDANLLVRCRHGDYVMK